MRITFKYYDKMNGIVKKNCISTINALVHCNTVTERHTFRDTYTTYTPGIRAWQSVYEFSTKCYKATEIQLYQDRIM